MKYYICKGDLTKEVFPVHKHLDGREASSSSNLNLQSNILQTKPPIKVGLSEIVSKNLNGSRLGARDKTGDSNLLNQGDKKNG